MKGWKSPNDDQIGLTEVYERILKSRRMLRNSGFEDFDQILFIQGDNGLSEDDAGDNDYDDGGYGHDHEGRDDGDGGDDDDEGDGDDDDDDNKD